MKFLPRQPFTWLLVIASVALDLAALGVHYTFCIALAYGQAIALGGFLVLGRGHRLLRGAVFVAGTLAVTLLMALLFMNFTSNLHPPPYETFIRAFSQVLVFIAMLAGASAVLTLCCASALGWLAKRRGAEPPRTAWRFPVSEIFGWMVVVAVASAIMRLANYASGSASLRDVAALALICFVAALNMSLFAVQRPRQGRFSEIIALAAVVALLGGLPLMIPEVEGEGLAMIAGALFYVACWIVAQRLDLRRDRVALVSEERLAEQ